MSQINVEIPDNIYEALMEEADEKNVPASLIIIQELRERYQEQGRI